MDGNSYHIWCVDSMKFYGPTSWLDYCNMHAILYRGILHIMLNTIPIVLHITIHHTCIQHTCKQAARYNLIARCQVTLWSILPDSTRLHTLSLFDCIFQLLFMAHSHLLTMLSSKAHKTLPSRLRVTLASPLPGHNSPGLSQLHSMVHCRPAECMLQSKLWDILKYTSKHTLKYMLNCTQLYTPHLTGSALLSILISGEDTPNFTWLYAPMYATDTWSRELRSCRCWYQQTWGWWCMAGGVSGQALECNNSSGPSCFGPGLGRNWTDGKLAGRVIN